MALNCGIHYKTIARLGCDLKVSEDFWSYFWEAQKIGLNFDGELFGSGLTLQQLINFGFKGPDEEGSNCWLNYRGSKGYPFPDYSVRNSIPTSDRIPGACVKRTKMKAKLPAGKTIGIAYNKGNYQIVDESDITTMGKKI